jgi:hypothetical protein
LLSSGILPQPCKDADRPLARPEASLAAVYAFALLAVNLYIARDFFSARTAHLSSMHGFWTTLAMKAGDSWFHPTWWPYWDCGIPFEATYAPLVPALAALLAWGRGIPHDVAFQATTGIFYCLAPLTLFLMAWVLTRRPGCAFGAALLYSLTSPTQLLSPDGEFALRRVWEARRLYVVATWDDTPHLAALSMLPLAILFLTLSLRKRRPVYYAAAAFFIGLAALASAFGPVIVVLSAVCLLFVYRREDWRRNVAITVGIGAYGYAIAAAFLSPSLILAVREATANSDEDGWSMGSWTAIAVVILGWTVLWRYLPRWTQDWRLRFFALLAYLMSSIPLIDFWLHRHFLPQSSRYKFEMETALALLVAFTAAACMDRLPRTIRAGVVLVLLALAAEQVVAFRKMEKTFTFPQDVTQTLVYRASIWAGQNLPGRRAFLPGPIAKWANRFADVQQFDGGSFSMATNQSQQNADAAIVFGGGTAEEDARLSLTWLKAYGVAVVGTGSNGKDFWASFTHPGKFDGVLPVLWREGTVSLYQVPLRSAALAHVVPEGAMVRHAPKEPGDVGEVERYAAALDYEPLPAAQMQWEGRNRIRIRAAAVPTGQAISVQVSYHPGWHAKVGGQSRGLYKDGLGLMWLRPECAGPCEVQLDYDGGWELRICRWVSAFAIVGLLAIPLGWRLRRKPRT